MQKSWKMHRDRLQEYVLAYRDAVAKLKHSYHQRDKLCKKLDLLTQENKTLTENIERQSKNHKSMIKDAQLLAQKMNMVSQQMNTYPHQMTSNPHQMNNGMNGMYHPGYTAQQQYYAPPQQQPNTMDNVAIHNGRNGMQNGIQNIQPPHHQISQLSQEMSNCLVDDDNILFHI